MATGNSWDDALNEVVREEQRTALKQSVFAAVGANPEQEAKIQNLSKQSGIPSIAVRGNEVELERRQKLEAVNVDQLMAGYPALSESLKDQDFAKIAIDDIHNLKKAEGALPKFGQDTSSTGEELLAATEQQAAYMAYIGAAYGLYDVNELADFAAARNRSIVDVQSRYPGYVRQYKDELAAATGALDTAKAFVSNPRAATRDTTVQLANMALPYAAAGAAGAATSGPVGALGGLFAGETLTEMGAWIDQTLREKGVDVSNKEQLAAAFADKDFLEQVRGEALRKGIATAAIDIAFAGFGGKFLSRVGATASLTKKVGAGALDIGVQAVGEGVSEAAGQLAAVGQVDTRDVTLEALSSLGTSTIDTAVGFKYHTGVMKERADALAEQRSQSIDEINQLARESQLVRRNPDAARDFIEKAAPDEMLYLDGERGIEFFQSLPVDRQNEILNVMPNLKQRMEDAVTSGVDIEISKADYFAFIAPQKEADGLKDFIKFSPPELTAEQLRDIDSLVQDFGQSELDQQTQGLTESEATAQRITSELMNAGLTQNAARLSAQIVQSGQQTLIERYGLNNEVAAQVIDRAFEGLRVEKAQLNEATTLAAKVTGKARQFIGSALKLKAAAENQTVKSREPRDVQKLLKLSERPKSLVDFIKDLGGIRPDLTQQEIGNVKANRAKGKKTLKEYTNLEINARENKSIAGLVKGKATYGLDQLARLAKDAGYLADENTQTLIAAIEEEAGGNRLYVADIQQKLQEAEQFSAVLGAELQRLGISAIDDAATIAQKMSDAETTLFQDQTQYQDPRGSITFDKDGQSLIKLFESRNLSTFLHEMGHFYVNVLRNIAKAEGDGVQQAKADWQTMREFVGHDADVGFTVEQEEKLARAFEAYLMEGEAPSQELRTAFERFKSWILSVYRSVMNLDVKINQDIRDVFDRLLASDEQIEAMRNTLLFKPNAQVLGILNKSEREAYIKKGEKVARNAKEKLFNKMMRQKRRELTDWYADEEKKVRTEVEGRVNQSGIYRVVHFLQNGEFLDGAPYEGERLRLNRRILKEAHGEEVLKYLPAGTTDQKGADPAVIAEMFGFSSSDQMVQAMINLEDRKTRIDSLVKEEMFVRYGDILNDGTIEREALEAMQNGDRADQLVYEYNKVGALVGIEPVDNAVFKAAAQQILEKKRLKDETRVYKGQEIKAKTSPTKYYYAEVKAAREFGKALGKKDYAKAAEWKKKQVMAHNLYREARAIEKEITKAMANFRRLNKRPDKGKHKIEPEYHQVIWNLLAKFGVGSKWFQESDMYKSGFNVQDLAAFIDQRQADDGAQIVTSPFLVLMEGKSDIADLRVDEFRALNELISSLETQGRNIREFTLNETKRDFYEVVDDVIGRIQEGLPERPETLEVSKLRQIWDKYWVLGIKPRTWIRQLDQSETNGLLSAAFIKPIDQAIDKMNLRLNDAGRQFRDILLKHYSKDELAKLGSARHKVFIPKINQSITKETMLMIALNWGNDENKQALIAGERWSEEFVESDILSLLDERDWQFVRDVWGYLDSFWGDISSTAQRRYGFAPKRVVPGMVATKYGNIVGGYFPIKADSSKTVNAKETDLDQALREARSGNSLLAQTRSGHTKERVGAGLNRRRLKLSFGVITGHVNSVIRDIELGDAVNQTSRLLNNRNVKESIAARLGIETFSALDLWLKDIAVGDIPATDIATQINDKLRANMTTAYMGFSIRTFVQQFSGFSQSAVYLGSGGKGWKWLGKGAMRLLQGWMNDGQGSMDIAAIHDASPFMRMRHETFNRDINETMKLIHNSTVPHGFKQAMMWHIMKAQQLIDAITWLGAQEKAAQMEGLSDLEIVQYADDAVRAQASGLIQDLSAIERGSTGNNNRFNRYIKLFSFMASYWNAKLNLAYEKTQAMRTGKIGKTAFTIDMITLVWLEAIIGEALIASYPGGEDDEDWLWWFMKQPLNMFIGGRELQSSVDGFGGGTMPIADTFEAFAKFGTQVSQGDVDASAIKAASSLTGLVTGLPSSQFNRIVNTVDRGAHGEEVGYIDLVRTRKDYER